MTGIIYKTMDKTHYKAVVFESASSINLRVLEHHIRSRTPVYMIEPFVSFHARKGPFHGFSGSLPDRIKNHLRKKDIALIPAASIKVKTIYRQAADRAVNIIESVFPAYKKDYGELFECVVHTLNSPAAENAFKKSLCHKLAEFYSVNILLDSIEKQFGSGPILVYPDTNVYNYLYLKDLLVKSRQDFFKHPEITFPVELKWAAFFENFKEYVLVISRLSAQTLFSGLLGIFRSSREKNKRQYSYGISVVSPVRQLSSNRRGPDFIVDNRNINGGNVVYLPLSDLTVYQEEKLAKLPGDIFQPPKVGHFFSHFSQWKSLLFLVSKKRLFLRAEEINTACKVFFSYFRWLMVLEEIKFRHFITHCDFDINHIGRNIALKQAGIQTWYYTDSMNLGGIYQTETDSLKHPFWTYLHYDNFVTWSDVIAAFFKSHPGSFYTSHVVGCLWSGHVLVSDINQKGTSVRPLKNDGNHFILSAYDSTYTLNAVGSYAEGISFAEDILKLADDFSDIHIFFKEKKPRDIHGIFDPNRGPELLNLYKKMDNHPRITTCGDNEDASEIISCSDMAVSFPFTSISFETLSANRPAVWHDPLGCYSDTPYAKAGGVTTHSYEELKKKVIEIKSMEPGTYRNPFQSDSPLMDPYRDGKAIDRFRDLLIHGKIPDTAETCGENRHVQV